MSNHTDSKSDHKFSTPLAALKAALPLTDSATRAHPPTNEGLGLALLVHFMDISDPVDTDLFFDTCVEVASEYGLHLSRRYNGSTYFYKATPNET